MDLAKDISKPARKPDPELERKEQLMSDLIQSVNSGSDYIYECLMGQGASQQLRMFDRAGAEITGVLSLNLKRVQAKNGYNHCTWFTSDDLRNLGWRPKNGENAHSIVVLDRVKIATKGDPEGPKVQTALVRKKFFNLNQIQATGSGVLEWHRSPLSFAKGISAVRGIENILDFYKRTEGFQFEVKSDDLEKDGRLSTKRYEEATARIMQQTLVNVGSLVAHVSDRLGCVDPCARLIAYHELADALIIDPSVAAVQGEFESAIGASLEELRAQKGSDFMGSYTAGREVAGVIRRKVSAIQSLGADYMLALQKYEDAPQLTSKESRSLKTVEADLAKLGMSAKAVIDRDGEATMFRVDCSDERINQLCQIATSQIANLETVIDVECALNDLWRQVLKGRVQAVLEADEELASAEVEDA